MKYICTANEQGKLEIFVFPKSIDHDAMAEVISGIKDSTRGIWSRVMREPVSAGFVSSQKKCHGESITLNLKSREEDTSLLMSQFD